MNFLRWLSQKDRVIRHLKAENAKLRIELTLYRIHERNTR